MAKVKVVLDHSGIAELLVDPGVRADLTVRAERVLEHGRSHAPVETGEYRDGLHIEQATTDRASVRVAGSTNHDWIVEARTGNLARALDAAR
jgi:hypothetical protein